MPRPEAPEPAGPGEPLHEGTEAADMWSPAVSLAASSEEVIGSTEACRLLNAGSPGTSNWREKLEGCEAKTSPQVEFDTWLETKLAGERQALMARLRASVETQLTQHHQALLSELQLANHSEVFLGEGEDATGYQLSNASSDLLYHRLASAISGDASSSLLTGIPSNPSRVQDSVAATMTATSISSTTAIASEKRRTQIKRSYKTELMSDLFHKANTFSTHEAPFLSRVASSDHFELISAGLILVNMLVAALEVQYMGCRVGHLVGHSDCSDGPGLYMQIEQGFDVVAVLFSVCFTVEFLLRMVRARSRAIYSGWMWLDFFVLCFGYVDTVNRLGGKVDLIVNPVAMRVARIARMFRVVRLFRAKESFHMLFLMIKSIMASRDCLVWSVLIVYFTMTCVGLVMNQLLYSYLRDSTNDLEDRKEVFEYFGTYSRMTITMYELTLGNWAPPTRVLMSKVSHWWGVFISVYRCVVCVSLVHVTAAVFITETSRVASDHSVQMMRKQRSTREVMRLLHQLFDEIDVNDDGFITFAEFDSASQDTVLKNLLEILEMEVETQDIREVFTLLDMGTGRVTKEEFVQGILRLRGQARSCRQETIMRVVKDTQSQVERLTLQLASLTRTMASEVRSRGRVCQTPSHLTSHLTSITCRLTGSSP